MIRLGSSTTFAALISYRCDMAFIEPMRRNKPNITYLLTLMSYPQNSLAYDNINKCYNVIYIWFGRIIKTS